ncbi:MAG: DUF423 domain-containing protein [Bacteriovoracaceae bacterium]
MDKSTKNWFSLILINFSLAISFGAMGAHALEKTLSEKYLETFLTGNRYHFLASIILFLLLLLEKSKDLSSTFKIPKVFILVGMIIFSGGCYLYAISSVKFFAMIVPIGGLLMILGPLLASITVMREP